MISLYNVIADSIRTYTTHKYQVDDLFVLLSDDFSEQTFYVIKRVHVEILYDRLFDWLLFNNQLAVFQLYSVGVEVQ